MCLFSVCVCVYVCSCAYVCMYEIHPLKIASRKSSPSDCICAGGMFALSRALSAVHECIHYNYIIVEVKCCVCVCREH